MKDLDTADSTPEDLLSILEKTVKDLHRQAARLNELAAQVQGLELLVCALASKVGWSAEHARTVLRKVQGSLQVKHLQRVEDRNPAAAASALGSQELPQFDEDILKLLRLEDAGEERGGALG
jgi:hypothetical protein